MGIYDRDWHKDERKQARQSSYRQPSPPPRYSSRSTRPPSPPIDIKRFFPDKPTSEIRVMVFQLGLFVVLIFAIYGAISLVQHLRNKPQKSTPATPTLQQPAPQKLPPEYHIKRAPTV